MNPHISDLPIGTEIALTWKRTKRRQYVARLVRRGYHGEEWRIEGVTPDGRQGYLMSEGWRWVSEHAVRNGDRDAVAATVEADHAHRS